MWFRPFLNGRQKTPKALPGRTDIQIDAAGAVVKVVSQDDQAANKAILLRLSEMPYAPERLRLNLQDKGKDFNSSAQIQYSNDLASWRTYDLKQTVAHFSGANKKSQYTLSVPSDGARYLLLTLGENSPRYSGYSQNLPARLCQEKLKPHPFLEY